MTSTKRRKLECSLLSHLSGCRTFFGSSASKAKHVHQGKENSLEISTTDIAQFHYRHLFQNINYSKRKSLPDEELCARNHRYLGLLMWCPARVWRALDSLESSLSVLFDRTHLRQNCTTWCRAQALKTMELTTLDLTTNCGKREDSILAKEFQEFESNTTPKLRSTHTRDSYLSYLKLSKQNTPTKDHG